MGRGCPKAIQNTLLVRQGAAYYTTRVDRKYRTETRNRPKIRKTQKKDKKIVLKKIDRNHRLIQTRIEQNNDHKQITRKIQF